MDNFLKLNFNFKKNIYKISKVNYQLFSFKLFNFFIIGKKKKIYGYIFNFFNFLYKEGSNVFKSLNLFNYLNNNYFNNFLFFLNWYIYYLKPIFFFKNNNLDKLLFIKKKKRLKFFLLFLYKYLKFSNKKKLKLKIYDFFINNLFNYKTSSFYLYKLNIYKKLM